MTAQPEVAGGVGTIGATQGSILCQTRRSCRADPDTIACRCHSSAPQSDVRYQIFVRGATGGLGLGFVKPDSPPGHPYIVTELAPGGAADISGAVKPGDTILFVDNKPVTDLEPAQVRELIVGPPTSSVVLGLGKPVPIPTPPNLKNIVLNRAETGGIGLGFNRSVGLACLLQNLSSPLETLREVGRHMTASCRHKLPWATL